MLCTPAGIRKDLCMTEIGVSLQLPLSLTEQPKGPSTPATNTSPNGPGFIALQSAVPRIFRLARVNSRPRHRRVRAASPHAKAAPEPPARVTRQLPPRHGRATAASAKALPPPQEPNGGSARRAAVAAPAGPVRRRDPSRARPRRAARAPSARRSPGAVGGSHMAGPGRPGPLPPPLPARSRSPSHPELIPLAAVPLPGAAPAAGGAPGPPGARPAPRRRAGAEPPSQRGPSPGWRSRALAGGGADAGRALRRSLAVCSSRRERALRAVPRRAVADAARELLGEDIPHSSSDLPPLLSEELKRSSVLHWPCH